MAKQVKIIKQIYIRKGAGTSFDYIGIAYASGDLITMDGKEQGEVWKGISDWYYKINEKNEKQYYWAGGCSPSNNSEELAQEVAGSRVSQLETLKKYYEDQIDLNKQIILTSNPSSPTSLQQINKIKEEQFELEQKLIDVINDRNKLTGN